MELRELTNMDIPALRELRLHALKINSEAFGSTYEEEAAYTDKDWAKPIAEDSTTDFIVGAFDDGKLIGMAGFFREERNAFKHKGTIWGVFVQPDIRRHGVGKALVKEAIKIAEKQEGLTVIQLSVAESNTDAINLYRHLGFEDYGLEPMARKDSEKYITKIHMWMPCGK